MLVRKFKDSLGINMTMKKIFIFVPVQTIKKIMLVPVQQYKHHVRSKALGSAVGLKVSARCSDAIRCISCELQLCCCIADVRGGSFNISHHVPRGSSSSCQAAPTAANCTSSRVGLLTLGRPCVRCYSTLRALSPVCGSTLRVSHDNITTTRDIYVPGTYTKFSFSFSV